MATEINGERVYCLGKTIYICIPELHSIVAKLKNKLGVVVSTLSYEELYCHL